MHECIRDFLTRESAICSQTEQQDHTGEQDDEIFFIR